MLRHSIAVFFVFVLLYLLTAGGHLYSPDEEIMFRVTESIALRGRLSIEPIVDASGASFGSRRGSDGKEYAQYGIGNSLIAVPFYYVGTALAQFVSDEEAQKLLDFKTVNYVGDGPGKGHQLLTRFTVSFVGIFIAALSCVLFWRIIAHRTQKRVAWATTIAFGAGTMVWTHSRTFFSEPAAGLFLLASFGFLCRPGKLHWLRAVAAGLSYALALLCRLDSAVLFPAIILLLLFRHVEARKGDLRSYLQTSSMRAAELFDAALFVSLLLFGLPIVAFLAFHFGMNALHFGAPFSSAYADQAEGIHFSTPLLAGLYGFLLSVGKSVFLFSPAILLGLAGYRRFYQRDAALALSCVAAVLCLLLFHSRWQNWAGGWCWGPRHIYQAHAFLMIPAAGFFLEWSRMKKTAFALIIIPAAAVQCYGCSQSFIDFYILYYRTPEHLPQAYVMFGPEDAVLADMRVERRARSGEYQPLPTIRIPAPINDSIYVPQNSQWYRYAEMCRVGYTDNLWLRLLRRGNGEELEIE